LILCPSFTDVTVLVQDSAKLKIRSVFRRIQGKNEYILLIFQALSQNG